MVTDMVSISVIIPTLNEAKFLARLLHSLKKQTFKDFEIVVSDSKSADKTIEIAKRYKVAKIVSGPRKGPGAGRNLGAKKATGEILLFCDADVILRPDMLKVIINTMNDKKIVGGSALTAPFDGNKFDKSLFKIINQLRLISANTPNVLASGFFCFYRKKIFDKLKGFNTKLAYCEDYDLAKRASRYGKFVLLNKEVKMSVRRYKSKGYLCYVLPILYYNATGTAPKELFKFEPVRF
jgi:glycosyltransferase involved in cell wall biosynthesis